MRVAAGGGGSLSAKSAQGGWTSGASSGGPPLGEHVDGAVRRLKAAMEELDALTGGESSGVFAERVVEQIVMSAEEDPDAP